MTNEVGVKDYKKKLRWSLVPMKALEGCVRVLMYGATTKYTPNNWKNVEPQGVYADAIYRHLNAYVAGEEFDDETGESHLSHLLCDALFLEYHRMNRDRLVSFSEYISELMIYDDYKKGQISQDAVDENFAKNRKFGEKHGCN